MGGELGAWSMEHVVRSGPNYTRGREPTRLADNNTTGSGITKIEELRGYPAVCNAEVTTKQTKIYAAAQIGSKLLFEAFQSKKEHATASPM